MLAALDSYVEWNGAGSKQLGAAAVGVKDSAAACQEFKFHSFHVRDGFVTTAALSVIGPSGPTLVLLCSPNSTTIFVKEWFLEEMQLSGLSEKMAWLIK